MLRSLVLTLALSLPITFGALAQTDASNAAAQSGDQVAEKPEKKICKRQARTGTRLSADRICKTAAEWDRYEQQMRDDASKMTEMRGDSDMGQ